MIEWDQSHNIPSEQDDNSSNSDFEKSLKSIDQNLNVSNEELKKLFELLTSARWVEISQNHQSSKLVTMIFKPDGSYFLSINGNVGIGQWQQFDDRIGLLIKKAFPDGRQKNEAYDPIFANAEFILLKKISGIESPVYKESNYLFLKNNDLEIDAESGEEILEYFNRKYVNPNPVFSAIAIIVLVTVLFVLWLIFRK